MDETDSSGNLLRSYVYGNQRISQTANSLQHYYHHDGLGSVRLLTNSTETITDTYAYTALGELTNSTGTTSNQYLFVGEQFDHPTSLYYLRARYYGPAIGRFISQDPFLGDSLDPVSLHPYLYAHNNPVNNTDPSGELTLLQTLAASAIIGTAGGVATFSITRSTEKAIIAAATLTVFAFATLVSGGTTSATASSGALLGPSFVSTTPVISIAGTLSNATSWQGAERIVARVLRVARNNREWNLTGMTRGSIPDFYIPGRLIADSKWTQTLSMSAQFRNYEILSNHLGVPLFLYVRLGTRVSQQVQDLVARTGGQIIRIFY